jgi:hypothetical protein
MWSSHGLNPVGRTVRGEWLKPPKGSGLDPHGAIAAAVLTKAMLTDIQRDGDTGGTKSVLAALE